MSVFLMMGAAAKRPRPVAERPTRNGFSGIDTMTYVLARAARR